MLRDPSLSGIDRLFHSEVCPNTPPLETTSRHQTSSCNHIKQGPVRWPQGPWFFPPCCVRPCMTRVVPTPPRSARWDQTMHTSCRLIWKDSMLDRDTRDRLHARRPQTDPLASILSGYTPTQALPTHPLPTLNTPVPIPIGCERLSGGGRGCR